MSDYIYCGNLESANAMIKDLINSKMQLQVDLLRVRAELQSELNRQTLVDTFNKQLQAEIDGFWEHLSNAFDIESKEFLEEEAKRAWIPPNPLVVALHYIWKRNPKVTKLQAKITKAIADLETAGFGEGYDFNLPIIIEDLRKE